MSCVTCGRAVKPNFNYFCRSCYRQLKHKFGVSRGDFRRYLRCGLGVRIHIPEDMNFRQVYDRTFGTHPTLYKLANLIENTLYLKLVFHKDFDLEAIRDYHVND